MAQSKETDVMIQLIDAAMKAGHKAKYVLFDSWFSNPRQIVELKDKGLDTIAMVKISSRIKYEYDGERKDIKQIYNSCKKRRGRSRYLLSVSVKVGQEQKNGHSVDARIVCVRNRANRKDWLALICTDMSLSETARVQLYLRSMKSARKKQVSCKISCKITAPIFRILVLCSICSSMGENNH